MTYKEFIDNILNTRGRFAISKNEYKERHHIIPKCMGGNNEKDNLIDLYAREHFIAHKLLALENPKHFGLVDAWWRMVNGGNNQYYNSPICTPEEYEEVKVLRSVSLSERMRGENNPCWGKSFESAIKKKVIEIGANKIYDSITQCAKALGVDIRSVSRSCVNNQNKDWYFAINERKYLFCFYDDQNNYDKQRNYFDSIVDKNTNTIKVRPSNTKNKKRFVWLNTGEIFDSFHEFERKTGLNATKVCACCRNKRRCVFMNDEPQVFMYYEDFLRYNNLGDAYMSAMKKIKCKRKVRNLITNKVYASIKEASIDTQQNESYIGRRCRGLVSNNSEWEYYY